MPRTKIMLPEGFVKEYLKHPSVERLALKYGVSQETVKARLEERGIPTGKPKKDRDSLRRDLSKELIEKRRVNTEMNNKYFAKNNIRGKRYIPSPSQKMGYYKT